MDKFKAQMLSAAIEKKLKELEEEHGITIQMQGGKFDTMSFTPKIVIAELSEDGLAMTPELQSLQDFHPELVGKEFMLNGAAVRFTGFRTRAPKRPLMYTEIHTGKKYITTIDVLSRIEEIKKDAA